MRNLKPETLKRYMEILALREGGMTYQGIADKYGFSSARAFTICKVARDQKSSNSSS